MELLSYEGDILVFGLAKVPKDKMHANDLVKIISEKGGITISAHPFRDNGRGMGEHIKKVSRLSGIEAFNGNTEFHQNLQAYYLSKELKLPCFGGSDAHKVEQIGKYATFFEDEIKGVNDLIKAVKERRVYPVKYNSEKNIFGEVIL